MENIDKVKERAKELREKLERYNYMYYVMDAPEVDDYEYDMLQRQLVCSGIEKIEGFWTTKKMNMKNVQTGHSTLLEMTNIVFGLELSDSIFTQGALERN